MNESITSNYKETDSMETNHNNLTLNWIVPIVLFFLTWFTTLLSGALLEGITPEFTTLLLKGLPFSFAVLVIVGAHGMGHYLTARKGKVKARFPYFIPSLIVFGTMGAFTKMQWPIKNRRKLLQVFSFGPICGFCASLIMFVIGLKFSKVVDISNFSGQGIDLNNSLITYLTSLFIFGRIPDTNIIQLHPIAFAGWLGFYYNLWHILPIGRLDGGRIIYGLWGYRITKLVSYATIAVLVALSFLWFQWIQVALFGIICMVRFRNQYPNDTYVESLDNVSKLLCLIVLIILFLSFSPIPIK